MRIFTSLSELDNKTDFLLGVSEWLTVDQRMISQFADLTGDQQWIHLNERQAREAGFGGTIAHGFLLLALIPQLSARAYQVQGVSKKVNYGLDRCRFIQPVLRGSELRGRFTLVSMARQSEYFKLSIKVELELRNQASPACVAQTLVLMYP